MTPRKVIASDGLVARDSGEWSQVKLEFLREYAPVALDATVRKHQRYFVDLFAGPGLNVGRETGVEFDGSPLAALQACGRRRPELNFTHLVACNWRSDHHEALQQRIRWRIERGAARIPAANIFLHCGRAELLIPDLMSRIEQKAYVLVFADIEGIKEWPWRAVEALRGGGHESLDLCLLFPLEMTLNRLLSYKRRHTERYRASLTAFFGCEDWMQLLARRITASHSPEFRAALIDLYLQRLRRRFRHARHVRDIRIRGGRRLYCLLFASDHDAGDRIADWASGVHERAKQTKLF